MKGDTLTHSYRTPDRDWGWCVVWRGEEGGMQSRRERGVPLSTWSAGWPGRVVVSCVSCGWGVLVEPLPDPVVRLGGGSAAVVVRTFVC